MLQWWEAIHMISHRGVPEPLLSLYTGDHPSSNLFMKAFLKRSLVP